jgi:hypothetical protein
MTSSRHQPDPHAEAHSRLTSLLSVCEHELAALETLDDRRLSRIIDQMRSFLRELTVALSTLQEPGVGN